MCGMWGVVWCVGKRLILSNFGCFCCEVLWVVLSFFCMQTFLLALRDGVPLKPSDVTKIPQSDLERLYPVYAGYYGSIPFCIHPHKHHKPACVTYFCRGYSGSHQFTLYLECPEYDRYVLDSISPVMMAVIFGRHAALQTIMTVYPSVNLNAHTEKGVPLAAMTRDSTILDLVVKTVSFQNII